MKPILSIFSLLLILLFGASVADALTTLSASPNPATVGQQVVINITAYDVEAAACSIPVDFDDGATTTMFCPSIGSCTRSFPHIYTAPGSYNVTTNSTDCALGGGFVSLTVNCPTIKVATSFLPGGIVGRPYSAQLLATGGVPPVDWGLSEVGDALPAGLTLSPTGLISGTPTSYGAANLRVVAEHVCPVPTNDQRDLLLNITSPATAELTITRLQLSFENGRAETTVNRNQPGLRAKADIRFNGTGLLQGYWEVDDRLLVPVNQHLTYGESIQLTSPAVPFLPTFVEGSHRVRLVITSPANDIPFPEAIYYVTSEDSTADLAPIRAIEPRNHAELAFSAQSFGWDGSEAAVMYLVEFFEKDDEDPVAAAYTKEVGYNLPESILTDKFSSGKAYYWRVKSYDAEGNLVGTSELSRFVFE